MVVVLPDHIGIFAALSLVSKDDWACEMDAVLSTRVDDCVGHTVGTNERCFAPDDWRMLVARRHCSVVAQTLSEPQHTLRT